MNEINLAALAVFPRDLYTYFAADKMVEDDDVNHTITHRYPNEYLNTLNPPRLPPLKLELKEGCPIMLLRNITPKDGLCNGIRLIIVKCVDFVIEAN